MSLANLDDISPRYLGDERIVLALAEDEDPIAGKPLRITVDYAAASPNGISIPLELVVQGSADESYQRRIFTRLAPDALTIVPREGGAHSVVLREMAHNRWWGRLRVSVAGEKLQASA